MKKGFTLVEIVVAMGIFAVASTMIVGVFLSIIRLNSLASNMKESQQKARIALEMITRLSKQAESVSLPDDKTLVLYFNRYTNDSFLSAEKFTIAPDGSFWTLQVSDCKKFNPATKECISSQWGDAVDLYGGVVELNGSSSFNLIRGDRPSLRIVLNGRIGGVGVTSPYYTDSFDLETEVNLENYR